MDLIECIESRSSIRGFSDEDVPEDLVLEMIRIGNRAPSAGNLQARDFVIVRDRDIISKLTAAALGQKFIEEAPVVIVCCANHDRIANYGQRGRDLYCIQDVSAAVQNMLLFITASGYGSCWIGAFEERGVSEAVRLPKHIRPVAMLPIGRPISAGRQTSRMAVKDIVHENKW